MQRVAATCIVLLIAGGAFVASTRSCGRDRTTVHEQPATPATSRSPAIAHAPRTTPPTPAQPHARKAAAHPDRYELTDVGDGYVAVNLNGGQSSVYIMPLDATPPLDRTISGRVVTDGGAPVPGAIVLGDETLGQAFPGNLSARSGTTARDDGSFELEVSSVRPQLLVALHPRAGWSRPVHVPPAPSDVTVELRVSGPGALRGSATYAGQGEQVEARLELEHGGALRLVAHSNEDGEFAFDIVPPGEYRLTVELAQTIAGGLSKSVAQAVTIEPGRTTVAEIELPVGVSLAIVVDFPDAAAPALVSYALEPADQAPEQPHFGVMFGGADAMKVMQYHDLEPGSYRVCVRVQDEVAEGGGFADGRMRCVTANVTQAPPIQELHVDLR